MEDENEDYDMVLIVGAKLRWEERKTAEALGCVQTDFFVLSGNNRQDNVYAKPLVWDLLTKVWPLRSIDSMRMEGGYALVRIVNGQIIGKITDA